jgi:hypothetical protein
MGEDERSLCCRLAEKVSVLILLGALSIASCVAASAQIRTRNMPQSRASQKASRKQQKAMKKYAKAQRKAQRKMLKTERKNTKLPQRRY